MLSYKEVKNQSNTVFNQFGESKWIPHAKENSKLERRPIKELRDIGVGRCIVLAAMGESTEANFDEIKRFRNKFDLAVNDKLFGYFVNRGVIPDFVFLSDASIPFKWIEKHIAKTKGVRLIATPYANTEWTKAWLGPRYFYVNADIIGSEKHFLPLFPETQVIPASSNVSNSMVCFFTGVTNGPAENRGGYEKYILTGYDYSWRPSKKSIGLESSVKTGKYYAFEETEPKRFYMNHRTLRDINGDWVHTSENLYFSARWMHHYVMNFRLPLVNCSGRGLLDLPFKGTLFNELDEVNSDPIVIEKIKSKFGLLKEAVTHLAAARQDFEKTREELIYVRR